MASHLISYSLNDALYRQLLSTQKGEGKDFTVDGVAISPDLYAKEKLINHIDPDGKLSKTKED